jgi:hypothetical protein
MITAMRRFFLQIMRSFCLAIALGGFTTTGILDTRAQTSASGTWRLVRTPNPSGGREAIAIIQTADVLKSDIDFAGLMVRCGESDMEVLVTLLAPLSPRAHPHVALSAGGETNNFTAAVAPPGALLLLPKEATALARGLWQSLPELSVKIDVAATGDSMGDNPLHIYGIVDLGGLGPALARLQALCVAQ